METISHHHQHHHHNQSPSTKSQAHNQQQQWSQNSTPTSTSNSFYFNTKSSPIDFSTSVLGTKDNEKSKSSNGGTLTSTNSYLTMTGKDLETPTSISRLPTLKSHKSTGTATASVDFHSNHPSITFSHDDFSIHQPENHHNHNNHHKNHHHYHHTDQNHNHHHNYHHHHSQKHHQRQHSSTNNNNNNETQSVAAMSTTSSHTTSTAGMDMQHFIDHEFPPNKKSIENRNRRNQSFSFLNLIHSIGMKRAKCWLRPSELNIPAEESFLPISLYSSSSSRDVLQGGIGSCWFISALSVIAERPELLSNILVTKSYNANGLHQIRLCKRGEWVTINIDDYLPCDRKGKVIFAYARYRQLWVSFIEKALAKLYGGYKAIVSGACVEGLQTLTGEPCEIIYLDNAEKNLNNPNYDLQENKSHNDNPWQLWKRLLFAQNAGYLMTTLCYKDDRRYFDMHRVGLFKRHIYSVLDVREFSHNGQIINLVKLRNPWGKKEWKGQWSNQWSHWPEHIKSELALNSHSKNDGCFWISFQDLLKYFYDISICKIRSDWFESRHSSLYFHSYLDGTHLFVLNVVQPGEHQFEIELFATGRKFQEFDRNADPDIDLCLVICRVDDPQTGKGLTCMAFEHNVEYFINLSARLSAGYYFIFATSIRAVAKLGEQDMINANAEFKQSTPNYHSYNLVIHGQSNFVLNQAVLPPEIVADVFYSVAKFSDKVRYELNGNLRTLIIPGSCTHAIIVENLSSSQFIRVNLDLSQSKNLESTRQTTRTCDILAPGTRQLIAYLTPINYRKGFVIGYKIESLLTDSSTLSNQPIVPYYFSGMHGVRSAAITNSL